MTVGELRLFLEGLQEDMEICIQIDIDDDHFYIGEIDEATVETRCDDAPSLYLSVIDPEKV